jgi:hypothetical protein
MLSFKATLLTAGLAVAASTSAWALPTPSPAPGPIPQPATGNSGLIISVYDTDPTRPRSITQHLGLNYLDVLPASMQSPAGAVLNFGNIDLSVFEGNLSTVRYTIFAADGNGQGGLGIALSAALGPQTLAFPPQNGVAIIQNIISASNTFFSSIDSSCSGGNPCSTADGGTWAGGSMWGNTFGQGAGGVVNGSGAIGSALGFFHLVSNDEEDPEFALVNTSYRTGDGPAQWLLSATGALTYSVAGGALVPIPAAVWMLLSGLLGMGTIARRRQQEATA